MKKYVLIVGLAALAGGLAKAATFAGLLGLDASTTAFLVLVLVGAGTLVADLSKKLEG
jgi:hypothetical protein